MNDLTKALGAALILSVPLYVLVKFMIGFVAGVRNELRAIAKEKTDAYNRSNREDDQRTERPDTRRDEEAS